MMMIHRLAAFLLLPLTLAPAASAAQAVQGRLIGRETQLPVRGGTVHLMSADSLVAGEARTDSAGRFTLQAPRPGRYWLLGHAPGYEESETDLFNVDAQGTRVSFVIGRAAVALDTVTATATSVGDADRLWYGGFHQRMRENQGGRFITHMKKLRDVEAPLADRVHRHLFERTGARDAVRDALRDAIEAGDYPEWELQVQVMEDHDHPELDFDPLDDTKVWPEEQFPLHAVGRMVLDRAPENFFAENEQIGLTIVGPEATLSQGVVDAFRAAAGLSTPASGSPPGLVDAETVERHRRRQRGRQRGR